MNASSYGVRWMHGLTGLRWLVFRYGAMVAGLPASIHANAVCAGLCAGLWHWGR